MEATQVKDFADKIQAAGLTSCWCDEAKAILPADLTYDEVERVAKEIYFRRIQNSVESFETTTAIHLYMKEQVEKKLQGIREPRKTDLSRFTSCVNSTVDQWGKARKPWKPEGKCGLKMKLSEAVSFASTQEAYADYSTTLIPVLGTIEAADKAAAERNVANFFRRLDTHTGWAGSGCNYTASLVFNSAGALIVLECRASIAD